MQHEPVKASIIYKITKKNNNIALCYKIYSQLTLHTFESFQYSSNHIFWIYIIILKQ